MNQVCNTVMIPVEEYEALRRERDELADKADAFDARWNTALTQLAAMAQERDEWKNACEQKTEIMRSHSDERRELQLQVLAAQAYAAQWWRVKI